MKYTHYSFIFGAAAAAKKRSDLLNYLCIHHVTSKQRARERTLNLVEKSSFYSFITPSHITHTPLPLLASASHRSYLEATHSEMKASVCE
jgi:hypothetical protein